jgi:hypothetical protein
MQLQRVQKGTHAAPGRQVSTWAHALKTEASAELGVGPPLLCPSV